MKRIIAAAVLSIAALFAIPVATASADEASYISDLASAGFGGGEAGTQEALAWGYAACRANANGLPIQDQVRVVYNNTGASISWTAAQYLVESAQIYLC